MYVDGSTPTTHTLNMAPDTPRNTEFYLVDYISTMSNFAGMIDEVSIATRAISQDEVIDLLNAGFVRILEDSIEANDDCPQPMPK